MNIIICPFTQPNGSVADGSVETSMVDQEQDKEQDGLGSVRNLLICLFVCLFVCLLHCTVERLNNRHVKLLCATSLMSLQCCSHMRKS